MNGNSKIMQKHGKTFFWASLFLKGSEAKKIYSIYAFCRNVDDIVDERNKVTQSDYDLKKIINSWRKNRNDSIYQSFYEGKKNLLKVEKAVLEEFYNGQESDVLQVQPINISELLVYCYRVAGVVGLMVCNALNINDKSMRFYAIDLGIAMQLTNIARDIYEDAQKERIYLPKSLVGKIGAKTLLKPSKTERLLINNARDNLIKKAEIYYESALNGIDSLPNASTQRAVRIAARLYRHIGIKIIKRGISYNMPRVYLNTYEKIFFTIKNIKNKKKGMNVLRKHNANLHASLSNLPYTNNQ